MKRMVIILLLIPGCLCILNAIDPPDHIIQDTLNNDTLSRTDLLIEEISNEALFQTDTLSFQKKLQVVGIPVVFYTPETSFGLGG